MKTILILIGPPGSGKGTQATCLLTKIEGLIHLSTGDLLRAAIREKTALGILADSYVSAGKFVPDDLIIALVDEKIHSLGPHAHVLLDGYPRTLPQMESLWKTYRGNSKIVALWIDVPLDVLKERLSGRLLAEARKDDAPEIVDTRLAIYQEQTAPILDWLRDKHILTRIDGNRSPDAVFDDLCKAL